jgi:hypothetical protein
MTRDDIIRMAREAGDVLVDSRGREEFFFDSYGIERFASLVAAAERLAVKKDIEEEMTDELDDQAYHLCMELIAKILKRGAP